MWLLFVLIPYVSFAQFPSGIIWDKAVGCQQATLEYGFNVGDPEECIKACENSTITYTLVGGDPQQWTNVGWQVTGGNLSTSTNTTATIQWGSQGWGIILVSIETENGIFEQEICVEILPAPIANFTVFPEGDEVEVLYVCEDELVYFENLSTTGGGSSLVSYLWYFEKGITSAEFEPTHVFADSGTYTVSLTVTNACNCTSTREIRVEVLGPGLQIVCNSIMCENEADTYTVEYIETPEEPVDCEDYVWEAVGGTIIDQNGASVIVQWDQVDGDGFGYLTFYPEDCNVECASPVTIKVPVIVREAEIDGPIKICAGAQFRYSIPQWPSTEVQWKVTPAGGTLYPSDQPNEIIFAAAAPGNYVLEAIYTNTLKACGGVALKEIEVIPNVQINGPSMLCQGESGHFVAGGILVDWVLDGPGGTQTGSGYTYDYLFNLPGLYTLTLGQGDFCLDQPQSILVTAKPAAPPAILGPSEVCPGKPEHFGVDPGQPGTTHWAVENGHFFNGDAGQGTTVVFDVSPAGPYVVKAWNVVNGCASDIVQITVSPVVVSFNVSGAQMVCSSSYETYSVDYLGGDQYEWSISPGFLGSVVTNPQGDTVDILWNNVSSPTNAVITVQIEKCGNLYTEYYAVTVQNAPPISITAPSSVCRDEVVNFGITGLTGWSSISWDFGDGNTASNTVSPAHAYADLNANNVNYTVTVVVEDPNGCINNATATFNIQVEPAPVGYIDAPTFYGFCSQADLTASPVTFNLVISSGYVAPVNIQWYRNGNPTGSGSPGNTSITTNDFGDYHAVLTSANGCISTTQTAKVVLDDCGPGGPGPGVCTPSGNIASLTVQMTGCGMASANSSYSGTPISYDWLVGPSGVPSNETATSADFSLVQPGSYTIFYRAEFNGTDDNGNPCTVEVTRSEGITIPYRAGLVYEIECGTAPGTYDVTLYDNSSFIGQPIQNFDFRVDGASVGASGPVTVALAPGPHTLELEISSPGQFPCTATVPIDLPALPTVQINAPNEACAGFPVPFSATVNDPNLSYVWDFGDFALNSLPDPERVFDGSPASPNVTLTVTNIYNCSATATHNIVIHDNEMSGGLQITPPTACYGQTIIVTYSPDVGTATPDTYYWINEQLQDTTTTTTGTFPVTEPGHYVLSGTTNTGCSDPHILAFDIAFLETPAAYLAGPNEACEDGGFSLLASPADDDYSYVWKRDGQVLSQFNDQASIVQNLPPGIYNYEVGITAPSGCSDVATHAVQVFPSPDPPVVTAQLLGCAPYAVSLSAQANEPGTFVWSDGQSGPSIQVGEGGPYRVTFFNQYGCSSSFELDVPQNPEAYIWVHPEGCYEVCELSMNDHYLSGPSLPFQSWAWLLNGSPLNTGSGMVPDQNWAGNGFYQLSLSNGYCGVISEGMSWNYIPSCDYCHLEGIQVEGLKALADSFGNCYYVLYISLNNSGPLLSYSLDNLTNTGAIMPGGGVLPSGASQTQLYFYPPAGFAGGPVQFRLTGQALEDAYTCIFEFSINFPPCPPGSSKPAQGPGLSGDNSFRVVPNPAKATARISYLLGDVERGNYSLTLYDLFGRQVAQREFKASRGAWDLDLSGLQSGMYLVILRKNGQVMGHKRLVKE